MAQTVRQLVEAKSVKTKNKKYQPPKPTTGDTAHLVVSAMLSPIPGAGELLERFVTPPLQKRLEAWREEVAHALRQLESGKGINLSKLQSNERFISIVLQATTVAIRNHQKEKLTALKNAIINSATSTQPDEDLSLIFVRFIDEFTPTHIQLLSFFVREEVALREVKSYTRLYNGFTEQHLATLSRDEFKMFCGDLETRGMVRISQDIDDFEDIYQVSSLLLESTKDGFPRIIVTDIAKGFFEFIATQKAI